MKLLITGCGRSGTMYLANLLNAAGIKTAHESNIARYGYGAGDDYDIDVNWMRASKLNGKDLGYEVIQVVRHPLLVASSFKHMNFFETVGVHMQAVEELLGKDIRNREYPELDYWIDWNTYISKYADYRFDIASVDRDWIHRMIHIYGGEFTENTEIALKKRNTNTLNKDYIVYNLANYDRAGELTELAAKYGYRL